MGFENVFPEYDRPITDFIRDSPSPPSSDRPLPNDRLITRRRPRLRRSADRRRGDLPPPRHRPICLDERRDNRRRYIKDEIIKTNRQFAAATMAERRKREERRRMEERGERDGYERAIREVNQKLTFHNLKKNRKEKMRIISSQLASSNSVKLEASSSDVNHPPSSSYVNHPPSPSHPYVKVETPASDVNHPLPPTHLQPIRNNNDNNSNDSDNNRDNNNDCNNSNNPSPDDINHLPSTSGLEKVGAIANTLKEKKLPTYVNVFRGKTPPSTSSSVTYQFKATKTATSCYQHMKCFNAWFEKVINNMKKEQICIDQIRLSEVALELGTEIGDPVNRTMSSQVQSLIHQNLPPPSFNLPRNSGLPDGFIPIDFIAFGSLLHDLCRKYDNILAICPTAVHASFFEVFDFLVN